MKFKELIEKHTWEEICDKFKELYPDHMTPANEEGYKKVYDELVAISTDIVETKMTICLAHVVGSSCGYEEDYSGVDGEDGTTWRQRDEEEGQQHKECYRSDQLVNFSIEFKPWNEWLNMHVHPETLKGFEETEIVAHCMWEMTFIAFDEDGIKDQWDKIEETRECIENGTIETKTFEQAKEEWNPKLSS